MANKCIHTYIHTCVFDHVHFRKTYHSYSISDLKNFAEQILAALTRNPLNILVIVYTKCGFICSLELVSDKHQIHTSHCYFFIFM